MKTRAVVVIALFSFVVVALVAGLRRPFTRACAGDLAIGSSGTEGTLGPVEATVRIKPGPGEPSKLTRYPLGPLEVGAFSYGHDPPIWYTDLFLNNACYGQKQLGLGLIKEGTISLHRSHDGRVFHIVGVEPDGTRAFFETVKVPEASREYTPRLAGVLVMIVVVVGLLAIGVGRRVRNLGIVLTWSEGIVRDDGCLEPLDGTAAIPLKCACREHPGKKLLFVPRKADDAGPYREHARGRLDDHVLFSREEATRHAARLAILALGMGVVALGMAVTAFFLAGT